MYKHANMNRVYRLVWNEAKQVWQAVQEKSKGKGKCKVYGSVGTAMTVMSLLFASPSWGSDVVVKQGTGNAKVTQAANGVTVVDINDPNRTGLSHNKYSKYNVDQRGLVLNNGDASKTSRQSVLAGQVFANQNLNKQANIILNEVVDPNRSALAGYTEVLGGKADVVVANPYGITCSGCGFINTDRVTLSTGTPTFASDGSLQGLRVSQGDILINGNGLDGSAQKVLDLVTRSAVIDGQVNADDLSVTTGANQWRYHTRSVTNQVAATGKTPDYAIDSSALGGMYANRIRLVSTEAGVGVRIQGEAAARGSDFTIDAAGRIEIGNKTILAERNLSLNSSQQKGDAIVTNNSYLAAKNNLDLKASAGGISLNDGTLIADKTLNIEGARLENSAVVQGARLSVQSSGFINNRASMKGGADSAIKGGSLVNSGSISTGSDSLIEVKGELTNNGKGLIALDKGGTVDAGTLNNRDSAFIDLKQSGAIRAGSLNNDSTIKTGQASHVTVDGTLNNSAGGLISLDKHNALRAGTLNNSNKAAIEMDSNGTLEAGALTNRGGAKIVLADHGAVDAGSLVNEATSQLVAGDAATVKAKSLTNRGLLDTGDDSLVAVEGTLTNDGIIDLKEQGTIDASSLNNNGEAFITLKQNGVIKADRLSNEATVKTGEGSAIKVAGSLHNAADGLITQGKNSSIGADALTNAGTIGGDANTLVEANTLANSGLLQAGDSSRIAIKQALGNDKGAQLNLGRDSAIDAGSLSNEGAIQSGAVSRVEVAGALRSGADALLAVGSQGLVKAGDLTNSGILDTGDDSRVEVAGTLRNEGDGLISLKERGTVHTGQLDNADDALIDLKQGGLIEADALNNSDSATIQTGKESAIEVAGKLNNQDAGTLLLDENNRVDAGSIDNAGAIVGGSNTSLTTDALSNAGQLKAGEASEILVKHALVNAEGGNIDLGAGQGRVSVGNLENHGAIQTGTAGHIDSAGLLRNHAGAILSGEADSVIEAGTLHNSGALNAGNSSTIEVAGSLTNDEEGSMVLKDDGHIQSDSLDNSATLQLGDRGSIEVAGALNNSGDGVISSGNDGSIGADTIANGATLSGGNRLVVQANGLTNSGVMQAGEASRIAINNALRNGKGASINLGAGQGTVDAGSMSNDGEIQTGSSGRISVVGTLDNGADGVLSVGNAGTISADSLTNGGLIDGGDNFSLLSRELINNALIQAGLGSDILARQQLINSKDAAINLGAGRGSITTAALDNAGAIQTGDRGQLLVSGTLTNRADGKLGIGDDGQLDAANLDNSGLIDGGDRLAITADGLNNAGIIQAGADGQLQIAGSLTNGNAEATLNLGDRAIVAANSLTNRGVMQLGDDGHLAVVGLLNNEATGQLGMGAGADIDAANVNNRGLLDTGRDTTLDTMTLDNYGRLQAGVNSRIEVTTLNNWQGAGMLLANGAGNPASTRLLLAKASTGAAIIAVNLNNAGILQSDADLALTVSNLLNNSGQLLTKGDLSVRGASPTAYQVRNDGRIQAVGMLDIKGHGDGNAVDIDTGSGSVLAGGEVDVNADSLTLADGAALNSLADMQLTLNSLALQGVDARIIAVIGGQGTATLDIASDLTNPGVIHSNGNLNLQAQSITNTETGGISALDTLMLAATSGDLSNAGALYAGNQLNASSVLGTLTNQESGTIDSSGSMSLQAGTFINYSEINAGQDINVVANIFRNEVTGAEGGLVRVWDPIIYESRIFDAEYHDNHGLSSSTVRKWWHANGEQTQHFTNTLGTNTPQMIAGRNMTISGFSAGYNTGGVLAASNGTLTMIGDSSGAKFINDDLSLEKKYYKHTWTTTIDCPLINGGGNCSSEKIDTEYDRDNGMGEVVDRIESLNARGGVIAAQTLNASGFGLTNQSSVWAANVNSKGNLGGTGAGSFGTSTSFSGAARVDGIDIEHVDPGLGSLLDILGAGLPSNPNGYFVPSKNPGSGYLIEMNPIFSGGASWDGAVGGLTPVNSPSSGNGMVMDPKLGAGTPAAGYEAETNPIYAVGSPYMGSSYLERQLGFNPETSQAVLHLGDANYEAYLVRQQLVKQTGSNALKGYASEAEQMKALMDQAVGEAGRLGLQYGKALTPAQLAALDHDIVWMVEIEVNGVKALSPVVYLSQKTRDQLTSGAVISADNATMDLDSLTNTGGTIAGSESLKITSKGDITNTGGTITGGNVDLKSTEGSINNKTVSEGLGHETLYKTNIGKTAGISSTGNLSLDAAKDITVIGADVDAGGNAKLKAGGDVTFDTIEDKNTSTTHSSERTGLFSSKQTTTTTSTIKQVGSGLKSGGNLSVESGNDITMAGTEIEFGGDGALKAGGDLNFEARHDTTETHSSSSESGLGVGGGLYGSQKITTDESDSRHVGVGIKGGGDLSMSAGKDMTLVGAKVETGGDIGLEAGGDIAVLEGRDTHEKKTHTETMTILGGDGDGASGSASASASADAEANAEASAGGGKASASAGASAGASASAKAEGSAGFTLASTTDTKTYDKESKAKGSSFTSGGNFTVKSGGNTKFVGTEVDAGGDADLSGVKGNLDLLAAEDEKISTSTSTTKKIGIYVDSSNEASAGASASADAGAEAGLLGQSAGASASAKAGAEASSSTSIDFARETTTEKSAYDKTHQGTTIKSGGKVSLGGDKLTTEAAEVQAGTGIKISAKEIENKAVDDVHESSEKTTSKSIGLYVDGSAKAEASAGASGSVSGNGEVSGEVGASASAEVKGGIGVQAKSKTEQSEERSTTAKVTSFSTSGGDIDISADKISDTGTKYKTEGGDINLEADSYENKAAKDTHYSSSSSTEDTTKVGVYAKAGASAEASANTDGETEVKAEAGASVGIEASHQHDEASESSTSSKAVTGGFDSAGNINIKVKDKTTLEGTAIKSGGDTTLDVGELDYQAAHDTESSSSSSKSVGGSASIGIGVGSDAVSGEASASYEDGSESSSSSTAVVGGIETGGNLTIKSKGDARFEGTQIDAGGDASVGAGGNLTFDAAHDESSASSNNTSVEGSIGLSASDISVEASASHDQGKESSSTAQVANIKSGGNLTLSAGKDASFEGTNIDAGGDAALEAGGNVDFKAAKDTSSSESFGVSMEGGFGGGSEKDEKTGGTTSTSSGNGSVGGGYSRENSSDAVTGSIGSGGNLTIKAGKDASFEGTAIKSDGDAAIGAGGNVAFKAARSTAESDGVSASVGGSAERSETVGGSEGHKQSSGKSGEAEASYEMGRSSEASVASVESGGNLSITSGKDVKLEGTDLAADGKASIAAGGKVEQTAVTSSEVGFGVGINGSAESSTSSTTPPSSSGEGPTSEQEKKGSGSVSLSLSGDASTKGVSIEGGKGVEITAGNG